ncbi:chemotaxis protein CheX [Calycomorphotria hydatis]|uniref:Chemotaxis phosphatase CheX-like domain-containing protein n=1 Tax=Calycomorphotria hydatis TaxID=2528027 RepID=A0A517TBC3_9PLAN|nr:chemotaxis protein CheX [Calycomorphotria hydatis]QDT65672.1 hypothetical protein V22_29310 [Calycomorphotria hydatis]
MSEQLPDRTGELTAQIVNPILSATSLVFDISLGSKVRRTGLGLAGEKSSFHPFTAVIELTGAAYGTVCLNLPRRTAFLIVSQMLGKSMDKSDANVRDAVGEVVNMIAGNAKAELEQYDLRIGIPRIYVGSSEAIPFPAYQKPMQADFSSDIGPFSIIFSLRKKAEDAEVDDVAAE